MLLYFRLSTRTLLQTFLHRPLSPSLSYYSCSCVVPSPSHLFTGLHALTPIPPQVIMTGISEHYSDAKDQGRNPRLFPSEDLHDG